MRNRKVACLLILLFFSIIYGIKLIVDAKSHPKIVFTDLPGLIRTGYDFVDDSHAFPKLCTLLNDSLLLKKGGVKMAVFTNINLSDSTIDWCLSCYNDETELLRATDRCFFNIDLYEGGHIKVQNTPTQLSDIRGLAVDYIFYLDSASRRCIFTRRNINQEEELEISGAGVYMKVHIEDNNGFSISDWRVFYKCLYDLIKLFEDERNKISLKIWDKDYDSLSFQEKEKIVDLAGYRINIEFK